MDIEQTKRVRRYFGRGEPIKLNDGENEDSFIMNPVPFDYMSDLAFLFSKLQAKDRELEKSGTDPITVSILNKMDKDDMKILTELMKQSLVVSPDFKDVPKEDVEQFVSGNFSSILPVFFSINDLGASRIADEEVIKKVRELRKIRSEKDAAGQPQP